MSWSDNKGEGWPLKGTKGDKKVHRKSILHAASAEPRPEIPEYAGTRAVSICRRSIHNAFRESVRQSVFQTTESRYMNFRLVALRYAWAVLLCIVCGIFVAKVRAQPYQVDESFAPVFRDESIVPEFFERSDGSLWVQGVELLDGVPVEGILRYRADGSMDTPLVITDPETGEVADIEKMVEVGGDTLVVVGSRLYRLQPDGTYDPNYNGPKIPSISDLGRVFPSSDGGVLVSRHPATYSWSDGTEILRYGLTRLNADGSFDENFPETEIGVWGVDLAGRIYDTTSGAVERYLPSGILDPDWTRVTMSPNPDRFYVDPNGGGIVELESEMLRLKVDGTIDPDFRIEGENTDILFENSSRMKVLPNGQILAFSGDSFEHPEQTPPVILRLLSDGRSDPSFVVSEEIGAAVGFWNDRVLVVFRDLTKRPRFAGRLSPDGSHDSSWLPRFGAQGEIGALESDLEGRVLVAGKFDGVDFRSRGGVARFMPDGTLDDNFSPPIDPRPTPVNDFGRVVGHGFRLGRDGSVFLREAVYEYKYIGSRWLRLTDSGSWHSDQPDQFHGDLSAGADGTLYYTTSPLFYDTDSDGSRRQFTRTRLWQRRLGSEADEEIDIVFPKRIYFYITGIAPPTGQPFRMSSEDRVLASIEGEDGSFLASVAIDGSDVVPIPLSSPVEVSGDRIYGYLDGRFRRMSYDGLLDEEFIPDQDLDDVSFLAEDGIGGVIVSRWDSIGERGSALRLRSDGSLDPDFNFEGLNVLDAAGSADGTIFLLTESKILRVAQDDAAEYSPHLVNLSARTMVRSEDAQQIAGFVLDAPAQMVIRGVGPSLADFGIKKPITDPEIVLLNGQTELVNRSGWGGTDRLISAFARIGAFPLPVDSGDAALKGSLPVGSFTAKISGGDSGVGLAEIYLDSSGSIAPLRNLSIRAHSGNGEASVIGGFAIAGDGVLKLLIRAVGPGLASFGIEDHLPDPVVTLHRDGTVLMINDDATDEAIAAEVVAGAFPLEAGAGDAAMIVDVEAGTYTASVSDGTGIVLLEVYVLP